MTDEEILIKAIEKVIEGGFNVPKERLNEYLSLITLADIYGIIFKHSFAKALWGEEPISVHINTAQMGGDVTLPAYKYHLQQMVIEENPIRYLERFFRDIPGLISFNK